jgi:hypothetical protein
MTTAKNPIQKEIEKIWPSAQKEVAKINKEASKFLKESEKKITEVYCVAKKKGEELILKARREELYYELGKSVAHLLTSDQLKNKNILRISSEIRQLDKKLRAKR